MPYSSVKGTLPAISVKTPAEVRISGSETDFSDYEGGGEKESTLTARVRQCSLQAINSVIDVSVTSAAVKKWETSFLFLSFSFSLFFFLSCCHSYYPFHFLIDMRNWIVLENANLIILVWQVLPELIFLHFCLLALYLIIKLCYV